MKLHEFEGCWALSRDIDDRLANRPGKFEGTAQFSPASDDALRYEETGSLQFPGQPALHARQSYIWQAAGPSEIAVLFADGRPFHSFRPASPAATHFCAPDHYTVAYDFSAWPTWRATWTVTGPRKDYVSITHYVRA